MLLNKSTASSNMNSSGDLSPDNLQQSHYRIKFHSLNKSEHVVYFLTFRHNAAKELGSEGYKHILHNYQESIMSIFLNTHFLFCFIYSYCHVSYCWSEYQKN